MKGSVGLVRPPDLSPPRKKENALPLLFFAFLFPTSFGGTFPKFSPLSKDLAVDRYILKEPKVARRDIGLPSTQKRETQRGLESDGKQCDHNQ